MGIFQKITGVFTSNVNSILDNMEQPDKILEIQIEKLDKQVGAVQNSVTEAIANRNMIEKKYNVAKTKYEEYDQKIELAITQGKEDLAREIAIEQNTIKITRDNLKKSLEEETNECENLKKTLVSLEQKQNDLKNQKYVLVTKYQSAKARNKVQDTLSKVSMDSPLKEINRMADKIEKMDAKACAKNEINSNHIDQKIASLDIDVHKKEIDDKIEEIRKKVDKDKLVKKTNIENPIKDLLEVPNITNEERTS